MEKPDLVDRSLFPTLPVIQGTYWTEAEVWSEFERAKGKLFGALLDALSRGLRNLPNVDIDRQFRMADFARFAQAASPAFGLGLGFYDVYAKNRSDVHQNVADSSPLCAAILQLVVGGQWTGTATELVSAMSEQVTDAEKRSLPSPGQIRSKLKTVLPLLRAQGVEYLDDRTSKGRWITFRKVGNAAVIPVIPVIAVTPSPVSITAGGSSESANDVSDSNDGNDGDKEVF